MTRDKKEWKRALKKTRTQLDFFFDKRVIPAFEKWHLSEADRGKFDALAGVRGRTAQPRLSDRSARLKSTQLLTASLLKDRRRAKRDGRERRYFFITLIDETGNTLDGKPEVNIEALRRKIDKAVRGGGAAGQGRLHAIIGIEVQAIGNYPQNGLGRMLMFHAHGIAWTEDRTFDPKQWADRVNASRSWHCELGADCADISELETTRSLARACAYMTKVPHDGKRRVTHRTAEKLRRERSDWAPRSWPLGDGYELVETLKGYRKDLALRIFEGLSQIKIADVVFGVNAEGAALRSDWKKRLKRWHDARDRSDGVLKDSAKLKKWWRELRRDHGRKRYKPWTFLTGKARPAWAHADDAIADPIFDEAALDSHEKAVNELRDAMKPGDLSDL